MTCKICSHPTQPFVSGRLRHQYDVQYFACPECEFIQTEEPFWLQEAYAEPITRSDVGYVARNVLLAKITKSLLVWHFDTNQKFIDYGGGYGMFVRLMRDAGFDFYFFDKYCPNLFAVGFEVEQAAPREKYGLLTAFEVFEHLPDPLEEIASMLRFSESIFFSTELQPTKNPTPLNWSYYALEHGQHVSFYSVKTLRWIANRFNLNVYSDGRFLHLLTRKKMSDKLFQITVGRKFATAMHYLIRRESYIPRDHQSSSSQKNT